MCVCAFKWCFWILLLYIYTIISSSSASSPSCWLQQTKFSILFSYYRLYSTHMYVYEQNFSNIHTHTNIFHPKFFLFSASFWEERSNKWLNFVCIKRTSVVVVVVIFFIIVFVWKLKVGWPCLAFTSFLKRRNSVLPRDAEQNYFNLTVFCSLAAI